MNHPIKKWVKDLSKYLPKEDTQVAAGTWEGAEHHHQSPEKCRPRPLRGHFTPTALALVAESDTRERQQGVGGGSPRSRDTARKFPKTSTVTA